MAYPFFMLFTFLTAHGQHASLPYLLDLEFEQVRSNETDEDGLSIYYANLADILKVLFNENEDLFEELREARSERISRVEKSKLSKELKAFLEAEIKLQWAFLDFRFGKDWDAFWGLRSASKISKELLEEHPSFKPNLRTQGLLNIIFGTVPSNRQWLLNLFGLKGNVFTGIDQIESLINQPNFSLESRLILAMTEIFLLEEFKSGQRRITETQENYVLVKYIKSLSYLKTNEALKARELLSKIYTKAPVLEYFLAETYFQEERYQESNEHFKSFLKKNEGTAYLKDAHLKIGIAEFYLNNTEEFRNRMKLCEEKGEARTEIDKNALKLMRSIDAQDSVGLLIRFAIDGGFFNRANELIAYQETRDLEPYYRLELSYRKARLAHLQQKQEEAVRYYENVIDQASLISETYYAPNSFLQIGYLMRDEGNLADASMYFEKVLEFKNHPYKKSLDNKAKLALASLDRSGG